MITFDQLSAVDDPRSFYEQARFQLVCAKCKRPTTDWEAHHVVQKQRCRVDGAPRHSPDNALRICDVCHQRHTNAVERISLDCLLDENIAFANRWLGGTAAYVYLTCQYAGTDPRVDALLEQL